MSGDNLWCNKCMSHHHVVDDCQQPGESVSNDWLCVGVYHYYGKHDEGEMQEAVLAVSDKDAMRFLDDKYKNLNIFAGGICSTTAGQITLKAKQVLRLN